MTTKRLSTMLLAAVLLGACDKNPIDKLTDPTPNGAVPQTSGTFTIFDDELMTGGGLGFTPTSGNQEISLRDRNARTGTYAIRYSWNGQPVGGQQDFAGFSLLITPSFDDLMSKPAKDLTGPGYAKLVLYVRGQLSRHTYVRIEGPDDGVPIEEDGVQPEFKDIHDLDSTWQRVEVPLRLNPPKDLEAVRVFLSVTFLYGEPGTSSPGEGGTIYIDDVRYE